VQRCHRDALDDVWLSSSNVAFVDESRPTTEQRSPHAEQVRRAMGWDRLPTMTPEERSRFEADEAAADEAVRRHYGVDAA
jgi:hypothetical protein